MAKAFVLVVFLALAAASADARVLHRLERGRSLASAGATEEADAIGICTHATFPKLCRALIPSLSHPITSESLTEAAIKITATKAQEAKAAASRFMANPTTTQQVKETLAVCSRSFDTALASLGEATKLVGLPKTHDAVMVQLQSALANVGNCEDAFTEFPGVVNPIAHISSHLEKLTSNSLSLALGAVDY